MKRISHKLTALSLAFSFFFSSCAADQGEIAALCDHLKNLGEEKYLAHITAVFPKREVSFSLEYRFSPQNDDRVKVIAPEEIAGIAFSVSEDDSTLEFDGARLTMGSLDTSGTSPLSAIPSLISVWRGGNFDEALSSDINGEDAYLMIYRNKNEKNEFEYRTWFSKNDFSPLYAEIYIGGIRVIECNFERMR
ncbi:MAG: hypothetical protein IJO61_06530 [Oscillospiraceae bacterium]|nr:hypothetical protein [Oscillospiraceae bacterium]